MRTGKWMGVRLAIAAATIGLGAAVAAPAASAGSLVRFDRIQGVDSPGTPPQYNRVGILQTGPRSARNILVLNPGTSASSAYFEPLAKTIVSKAPGWQVWAVERRENLLEDQSIDTRQGGQGDGPAGLRLLPRLAHRLEHHQHFQLIPDAEVGYARDWGMNTEIGDLRKVVLAAQRAGRNVVVGGHSLGGSITTAYATWDFHGKAGAKGLSGLVYIDGGSGPVPVSPEQATQSLALNARALALAGRSAGSPRPSPACSTPPAGWRDRRSQRALAGHNFPLLPANLKPPVLPTNEGQFGYALDTETSPPGLAAAQAHLGHCGKRQPPRLGPGGRADADPPLRQGVLRLGPQGPRRHGLVPPAAADDRRRRGCRWQCEPGAGDAQGAGDPRRRPLAGSCGSTPSARRSAGSGCSTRPRPWPTSRASRSAT